MMPALVKTRCLLRRLGGIRKMMMRPPDFRSTNNNTYYTTTTNNYLKTSSYSFNSFCSQFFLRGSDYKCTARHSRCMYFHSQESNTAPECDSEKQTKLEQWDVVNVSQLLFTKDRDYLIRYNDPRPVTAEHLTGKYIVLYFVPLYYDSDRYPSNRLFKESLMDIYNDLKFKNCFEVVMVVDEDTCSDVQLCADLSLQGKFEEIFSKCPSWAAIPFSDITSRKRLKSRVLGHFGKLPGPLMILIEEPTGWVWDTSPEKIFYTYGSEAYPFDLGRIGFLEAKDKTAFSQHSLKELLGSSERDFVISNKGKKVPIHTLEDKVVALFFYEDGFSDDSLTRKLMMCYNELKKRNQNFEVVLLYLYDTCETIHSTKEKFQKTFETMPWLALPYKDPVNKKLKRIFGYSDGQDYDIAGPSLVIVGPRKNVIGSGDIIEPGPSSISRGYARDLFMCEEFVKVGGERVSELKSEMLCSPNTIFKRNDGSQVQFSHLAGKRIIFLFEGDYPEYDGQRFREQLTAVYMRSKGTDHEFEVIYFPSKKDVNGKRIADMPWLISCAVESLHGGSAFLSFYGNSYNRYDSSLLLAFGRDGSLVRRAICPWFGDYNYPFYTDDVDSEAFDIERSDFCWGYWDTLHQGLLKDIDYQTKFPSANHLFCVYHYVLDRC